MAANVIVDAGFLIALLTRRDTNHRWAAAHSAQFPPPWQTCEAALTEAFHLLGIARAAALGQLLKRRALLSEFSLIHEVDAVTGLMHRYANIPMSFADACLVRMTETMPDPVLLTTDSDFRLYRRHGRQAIPYVMPD